MSDVPHTGDLDSAGDLHDSTGGELRQVVRSPEQVALHLPLAGPTSRMLAYAVDWLILWLGIFALAILLLFVTPILEWVLAPVQAFLEKVVEGRGVDASTAGILMVVALFLVVLAAAEVAYFVFFELTTGGRSPGKALVGLRVVRDGGLPLTPSASLLRNLLRLVDFLPMNYLTGLISILVSPDAKRLGDVAAGTVVVRLDRPQAAPPLRLDDAGDRVVFRFDRAQLARVGRPERTLLRQTLRRLDALPPDRAEEALARAVEVLQARLEYPDEVEPGERRDFLLALLRAASRR